MNAGAAPVAAVSGAWGPGGAGRYAVVAAVLAAWMALGWILHLDANAYLLAGVPLLALFQLGVARRPLAELWFAAPPRFALPPWAWGLAAAFMFLPLRELAARPESWPVRLWLGCALAGAVPLAWSVARCTRAQWREVGLCLLLTTAAAALALLPRFFLAPHADRTALARLLVGARSLALYLPVCFLLEEVFFRGGLDAYLNRGGDRRPWVSAFVLSAFWGWWHLPVVPLAPAHPAAQFAGLLVALPAVHAGVGALLSIFWRRSGLLLVPVAAHAFIDAVRNALQ